MQYTIDWQDNYSYVWVTGDVNKHELELASKNMHGDHRFFKTKASIWNFTQATFNNISEAELRYLVAANIGASFTVKEFKKALIITDEFANELANSFIKQVANGQSSWEIRVFESLEPALLWANT